MTPFAGTIAGYPIPWFALSLDVGLLAAVLLTTHLARTRGLSPSRFLDASIVLLFIALLGSRAWYVVTYADEFLAAPLAVFSVWEGGLALAGAITVAALAARPVAVWAGIPVALLLDTWSIGAALAQAVGRLGCIPAGCGAGLPTAETGSWLPSLALPDAAGVVVQRFPSQVVEALAETLLCAGLLMMWRRMPPAGVVAALYLAGYGVIRLLAEPLRADSTPVGPSTLVSVWAAMAVLVGISALLALRPKRGRSVPLASKVPASG